MSYISAGDSNSNFNIDSSSGLITTSATALSFFTNGASVTLVVAATDGESNSNTASVVVHVSKYKDTVVVPEGVQGLAQTPSLPPPPPVFNYPMKMK